MNTNALSFAPKTLWQTLKVQDWLYAILLVAGAIFAYSKYSQHMDIYEVSFLFGAAIAFSYLGWRWKNLAKLVIGVGVISLISISMYHGDQARATQAFFLKFLISSQSAVMWMNVLFILAMVTYWFALYKRSDFAGRVASALTWSAVLFGFVGLMVRWYESYLIAPDVGHIPISNLYEVFILFCLITSLLYLHYEDKFNTKQLGGFVLLIINAAVAFILWYRFDRGADAIQPLVPALQSYWMKIHVPANFVGYGSFSLAAMVASAYLLSRKGILTSRLPSLEVLDDVMYKAIAVGFAFFTIATILGAMWAAEAWGGYWSWDPKETWALIVWLNYAAWLHLRMVKGLRGPVLAWWALIGLLVTTFAFLGVNMFLSGLHSYGEL
ncbi:MULTISPECIES: c-type cytochrome biogenesis protein CcsB [Methylotenera]|uniref:c-type cytochrome biogenesis protein CcsB n=1 Tax=Methylotenera TaxID=359407 RepID=UPI00036398A2|nr:MULTISPECIES: c-type cytochrome biogenesis protein CcsB [Methylotenera]